MINICIGNAGKMEAGRPIPRALWSASLAAPVSFWVIEKFSRNQAESDRGIYLTLTSGFMYLSTHKCTNTHMHSHTQTHTRIYAYAYAIYIPDKKKEWRKRRIQIWYNFKRLDEGLGRRLRAFRHLPSKHENLNSNPQNSCKTWTQ